MAQSEASGYASFRAIDMDRVRRSVWEGLVRTGPGKPVSGSWLTSARSRGRQANERAGYRAAS